MKREKDNKWTSLETAGPLFPENWNYRKTSFEGELLSPQAEEMLWAYAKHYPDSEYLKKPIANKNFYSCLKPHLTQKQKVLKFPEAYNDVLVSMKSIQDQEKELKKNRSKTEIENEKKLKAEFKTKYGVAIVDGKPQQITNYMIEPPGLYLVRGNCPMLFKWKKRAQAEDVVINCSENPPAPPAGHQWKQVVCNRNSLSPYSFELNVNNERVFQKRITFTYSSDLGAQADADKYERALALHQKWDIMKKHIFDGMQVKHNDSVSEAALVAWLVQHTAIRIGKERGEDESPDVVGASTLQKENISCELHDNTWTIGLDFIGKDSIKYHNTFTFDTKNQESNIACIKLSQILGHINKGEMVFKYSDAGDVNKFLQECIPGITIKMFRPALGTHLLAMSLNDEHISLGHSDHEKVMAFNRANLKTANMLNHKRTVSKNFDIQLEKAEERTKASKNKLVALKQEAAKKLTQYKKDMITLSKTFTGPQLQERLDRIKEKIEKVKSRIEKAELRSIVSNDKLILKKDGKESALNTSRGSYISPLAVAGWCVKVNLAPEKLYTKTLLERFRWAFDRANESDFDDWV